jgi:shikimate 5-dehydrogenase
MEFHLVIILIRLHIIFTDSAKGANMMRQPLVNEISQTFASIRRSTVIPLVYHVVKEMDLPGSLNAASRPMYLDLTRHGLRLAPEFATIDLSLSDDEILGLMQVKGSTRLIAHCFSSDRRVLSWDHAYWISAYERARRLGFDVVRLCWPATCLADNFAVQQFRAKVAMLGTPVIPLVAYNTGRLGKTSCCFNLTLTPVTHDEVPRLEPKPETPSITAAEATRALYASFVFEPLRFYIVGASAGYSLSPAMHNAAYRACGMPHIYAVHETPTLNDIRSLVEDPQFGGCSVSLPFKLDVMQLTKSISCHANAIGAINTLIPVRHLQDDGSIPNDLDIFKERNRAGPVKALYGENSDWIGLRSCIRRGLSPANAVGPRTTALVIGAGGMARSAIYAMLKLGVRNIFIFNRTLANAETVVEHFSRLVGSETRDRLSPRILPLSIDASTHVQALRSRDEPWPEQFRQPTIIVSCIPTHRLGQNPSPDFTVPPQWLNSPTGGLVLEVSWTTQVVSKSYLIQSVGRIQESAYSVARANAS